ncbi:MAG TPA: MFS transporter [Bacteroidia bacterium]|jgi:MFS family permease|nr:MFS transporter [Bacteroidia bacterium]
MIRNQNYSKQVLLLIIVAGLGYFVDIYDLILFLFVKKSSLTALHLDPDVDGTSLLNFQMVGMLLGGIVWGILGDKRGRLSTLFLTILIYSLANIANGFVHTLGQYQWLRFIAGFGLAGELGVGITLVSELMSKETRGYGTSIVAGIGIAGAALGYIISQNFGWREAYWAGGILGILLLIMRASVNESAMFHKSKKDNVQRGNFFSIFTNGKRALKYLYCILIGMPVWFVIGIVIKDSEKYAQNIFHIVGAMEVKDISAKSVLYHYIGASIGSFLTGFLGQWLKSRKKALLISLVLLTISLAAFFSASGISLTLYYFIIFILGIAQGYWAVFITISSEQFGTNLRATVATTAPNFVRGGLVLMSMGYEYFGMAKDGSMMGSYVIGGIVLVLAFFSAFMLKETYGKELDYLETAE